MIGAGPNHKDKWSKYKVDDYIYDSAEAMAVEPGFIHKRHEDLRTSSASEAPAEEAAEEGGDE